MSNSGFAYRYGDCVSLDTEPHEVTEYAYSYLTRNGQGQPYRHVIYSGTREWVEQDIDVLRKFRRDIDPSTIKIHVRHRTVTRWESTD